MHDEIGDFAYEDDSIPVAEFQPARFEFRLDLPEGDAQKQKDAAAAVRQEYRDGSRWKRLNCHRVSIFAEQDRGTIFVVHVGSSVEFDWTWEGAKAFRPTSLDGEERYSDHFSEEAAYEEGIVWSGEIVEVDERNGCLFISLDDPEMTPATGPFFVRPFEFMSVLDAIYNGDEFEEVREYLPARLNASEGNVHPRVAPSCGVGLPHLRDWWQHSWSVLWGPPGTGKTWTTGQQIAKVMQAENERILVVSTTNRATDAVAISIGEAAKEFCPDRLDNDLLLRIGKGASYQSFVGKNLDPMLRGTESEVLSQIDGLAQQLQLFESSEDKALTRKRIGELRTSGNDQSNRIFVDAQRRVVVATAFKAMSYLKDPSIRKMVADGDAPFTTIFIDEAGLISRTAVAALSLLAARRVVLVGDSKQLAPISRISRILPTRQQTWLASSGLSHLDGTENLPIAVHLLSQQRRMHPDVCKVVSSYQYDGVLTTAQDMGPATLRLLLSIVEKSDENDANSRSAHIFYDNAQNVYDTKTPKWSEFGLDMRGRSTIMRESFRSTTPITELAVNVLSRLSESSTRQEQQELLQLGLLEKTDRNGEEWLRVRYNQIDGPKPIYHSFDNRSQEMASIAGHLKHLIQKDGISPTDICILYNGRVQNILQSSLAPALAEIGVELSFQKNRSFERQPNTLIATTPHSFKGYESEAIVIPCVDNYVAPEGKTLENSLYVAMTRARSLLAIYGVNGGSEASRKIGETIRTCLSIQNA
ncbi:RecBCD enzyme subunit RecD [Novipirellula aureliae]|uniref:RecBCD enzyme subunit RecD n=1 Tax=Novipirellula aureliae TaxID=2527966 RepID=A0A5C6E9V4_9BACT|nr:AAA family ATPase [Novipirellula aureliae]TWU45315.1 RecBCD enzyme subunit RecD [Novipirellula aureliae]